MNFVVKASTLLASLAVVASASAQIPVREMAAPTSVKPIAMQKIRMIDRTHYIALSKWIPYREGFGIQRVGNLILDAYEGNGGVPNDTPTDGLYGETILPTQMGARWTFSYSQTQPWVNTFFARRYEKVFNNMANKPAMGIDFLMKNNLGGDAVQYVGVFMSEDGWDPNAPVAPSTFLDGVLLQYNPIAPNSFIYSNVDLTNIGGMAMPVAGNGWYHAIFGSNVDQNNAIIEALSAQPGMWGTKPANPSQVSQYEYQDGIGDGSGRNGTFNTLYDWTFGYYAAATAYTITRGSELGAHDVAKLQGTAGTSVVVKQAAQFVPTFANAEVTATVKLDPNTPPAANLRILRAVVRVKANAFPLTDANCRQDIALFNRSTNAWVVVDTRKPTNPTSDGTLVVCTSVPQANIANYINPADSTVQVRVGVYQTRPLLATWNMTVNYMSVDASDIGPDPLAPAFAFSTPN